MRYNITKQHSTKPERMVYELLKELKIPFRHRWKVAGLEVDFLVGKLAIEIDGHEQDPNKNAKLVGLGYVPMHFHNLDIINNRDYIKKILYDNY